MNVSTRGRYSLRLMLEIARFSDGETPISLQDVASWTGVSRRYLEQLIIPLKNAGLVKAKPGRGGGYMLARDPSAIRLGDILAAATGPVALVECVDDDRVCDRSGGCECRLLWTLITHRIRDVLDEYSLADVVEPGWRTDVGREIEERRRVAAVRAGKEQHV